VGYAAVDLSKRWAALAAEAAAAVLAVGGEARVAGDGDGSEVAPQAMDVTEAAVLRRAARLRKTAAERYDTVGVWSGQDAQGLLRTLRSQARLRVVPLLQTPMVGSNTRHSTPLNWRLIGYFPILYYPTPLRCTSTARRRDTWSVYLLF
jgi:hypothetical protein